MPTYFLLSHLQDGYTFKDFEIEGTLEEYITEVLEIPNEIIETMEISNTNEIELILYPEKWILNEDWYYALVKFSRIQELSA